MATKQRKFKRLPEADEEFRLPYEGYYDPNAFVDVLVFWDYVVTGRCLIVAIDRSDEHKNTSVTNRVERVMYLAWQKVLEDDEVTEVAFAECYDRDRDGLDLDLVKFEKDADGHFLVADCMCNGKKVGPQFVEPDWSPMPLDFFKGMGYDEEDYA